MKPLEGWRKRLFDYNSEPGINKPIHSSQTGAEGKITVHPYRLVTLIWRTAGRTLEISQPNIFRSMYFSHHLESAVAEPDCLITFHQLQR
jgi:hypothetical protein